MYKGTNRSIVTVIILSIVTCGIYGIWWLYTVGTEINSALGRPAVNPVLSVLSIICFPILFYYAYTVDNALVELCQQKQKNYSSNFILWVITLIFGVGTIVMMIQVQTALNDVWES